MTRYDLVFFYLGGLFAYSLEYFGSLKRGAFYEKTKHLTIITHIVFFVLDIMPRLLLWPFFVVKELL